MTITTAHELAALRAAHANALALVTRVDVTPEQHAAAVELLAETTDALEGSL